MDTCVRCGAELGVGRFCVNCGHRIGDPAPVVQVPATAVPVPMTGPPAPQVRAWNPDEELLPYDDGTWDERRDAPLAGKAWVGWVVGAALLVALVFVLLDVFGVNDTDGAGAPSTTDPRATQEPGQPESATSPSPSGVGTPFDVARGATFEAPSTAPATTDLDGELVDYEADQMHDGVASTAWRMPGDGTGETIMITLAEPSVVSRVGLINGYAKQVGGVDWYPNNRRILAVQWGFDDGSSVEQTFTERPGLQRMKVPPVTTSTVTLTITAVTPPGAGVLGRDYTAISEVAIRGRRAG